MRRRKWWIILPTIIITGLAVLLVSAMTPQYKATASIMIDVEQQGVTTMESIVTGLSAGEGTISSQVSILLSRDFASRVIQKLRLYEDPEFNPSLRTPTGLQRAMATLKSGVQILLSYVKPPVPARVASVEERADRERVRIISSLLRALTVEPQAGTWVIDVSVVSASPVQAARIANTMAELYLNDQLEAKFEATKRAADWLTQRLSDLRAELEASEAAVQTYRSSAGLLEANADTTLAQQQISAVNTQLVAARSRRAEIEARLRQAEALLLSPEGAGAAGDVLQSPVVQNLIGQEATVARKIADLSASVGENHPDLIRARAEEQDLKGRIAGEIAKVVQSLRSELAIAQAEESAVERSLSQLETKVSSLNAKSSELKVLEREAQSNQTLYDTFLSRFKETQDQDSIQQSDARIISHADVPAGPSAPNKPILVALAFVFALLLGCSVVLVREQMERGLRSSEEINRYLRQPCLGLVPTISRLRLRGLSPEDYVVKHPVSAVAEAIRSIRTGIFLADSDVKLNGIVITSARPNEGKTSISISMARLNAMGGRRTILIDLDLRKPEVYRRLRAPSDVGIIDYLAGKATLPEIIQKDEPSGLEYIVAGRRIANFAELLRSSLLEELLSDLSRRYDLVVLDAPPVLAAADTRLIARFAGKTLFVVRWSSTPRHVVRLALNQLIDVGTDIAGVAVTLVDVRRNRKYSFGDSEAFTGAYKRYYAG
jgi:capsular exopolysaccharide synthesis family protein